MRIKIPELPEIKYDEIDDTDVMAIDDGKDTYKVPVSYLKTVFSCDSKIKAVSDNLTSLIDNLNDSLAKTSDDIAKSISTINNKLDLAAENIKDISKRLEVDERNIKVNKESIDSLTTSYTEFKSKAELYMQTTTEAIDQFKTSVNTELESIKTDFNNFKNDTNSTINDINSKIESNKTEITNTVTTIDKRLDEKIDRIHQELLQIIDGYHHETH